MDAFELKRSLDASLRTPSGGLIDAEAAWDVLRSQLRTPPHGIVHQELSFSVDEEDSEPIDAQPRMLLYMGWLIDAERDQSWRTVEVALHYHYQLTSGLADRLDDLRQCSFDTALDADPHDPDLVGTFFKRVDPAEPVWAALHGLSADSADFTCVVTPG